MDLREANFSNIRHPWELARQAILLKLINKYIVKSDKKIKILDVGSGDAYLANSLAKTPSTDSICCVDNEYTEELKVYIQNTYKNKKTKLHISLEEVKTDIIDLITLLDVMEHVPDDTKFLNEILKQTYVKNNAFVLISVPAYQILFSHHDELLKHYRRYNLKQLKETVNRSDLEFIEGGYFFSSLIIPRIINLILEKLNIKKQSENSENWSGSKIITTLIKNILLFDYKIAQIFKKFSINVPGLSCYAICIKRDEQNQT